MKRDFSAAPSGLLTGWPAALPHRAMVKIGRGTARPGHIAMLHLGEELICTAAGLFPDESVFLPLDPGGWQLPLTRQRDGVLLDYLAKKGFGAGADRLLCARGMEMIYTALATVTGEFPQQRQGKDIIRLALARRCLLSIETVERYCELLGYAAAEAAIAVRAVGGVYIAGPLGDVLGDFLKQTRFRMNFESCHARFAELASVPTLVARRV